MIVKLEIKYGDHCWLSPDIWLVPGSNLNRTLGVPITGTSSFVWARIKNNGNEQVDAAVVNFYWANPSTLLTKNTINLMESYHEF